MIELLRRAAAVRADLLDERHEAALRLLNGFLEGEPSLVVELYGKTAVLHNYANPPTAGLEKVETAVSWLTTTYPWLQAVIVKTRRGETEAAKRGELVWGTAVSREIREQGVRYAIDLTLNRDSSFYLDTRTLRRWTKAGIAHALRTPTNQRRFTSEEVERLMPKAPEGEE